jgi:hypothetical protein
VEVDVSEQQLADYYRRMADFAMTVDERLDARLNPLVKCMTGATVYRAAHVKP